MDRPGTANAARYRNPSKIPVFPCRQLLEKASSPCFFMSMTKEDRKMKQFTFRTEMSEDNERVPALLEAIGVTLESENEIDDAIMPDYKMGVFTFSSSLELEELRTMMEQLIDSDNDDRFVDMHRCHQTLAEGTKHNKYWFRDSAND